MMYSTITIMVVNQVTTGEKALNKYVAYYCLPLWTLRHGLCLNTILYLMPLFHFNAQTDGMTCYPFGTCSLCIISQ